MGPNETTVFLARQPIYDCRLRVFGYELLYRSTDGTHPINIGSAESAETISRALMEIGLDRLVGDNLAFINIPESLLLDPALELLPKERVVLEILEDIDPTDQVVKAICHLKKLGFKMALDDFVVGSKQEPLVQYCNYVKVDVLQNSEADLEAGVKKLKKARVRVLAEKVETMQMYAKCRALGFDYFQGYLLCRPNLVSGKGISSRKGYLLQVLSRLQDPQVKMDELEKLVSADVTLTYRLLRLVNSVFMAPDQPIDSVPSALMVLGIQRVTALISLLIMTGAGGAASELLKTAMVRAKMCEEVANALGRSDGEKHFTVGLLSVLEAILEIPMAEIVTQLPLAPDIFEALLTPEADNPWALSLRVTLAFEQGRWEDLPDIVERAPRIGKSYVGAVCWAEEVNMAMAA